MSALNAGCVDLALLQQVVGSVILGLTANNTLQVGLLDCHGNPLGKASVPSCDQMSAAIDAAASTLATSGVRVSHDDTLQGDGTAANPLKVNVCGIMTSVVHDSTLSGYGTCQSPLTVNTSWLEAFVLNLADTQALIHIAPDSGISGDGTTANPLALDVQHDASMYGLGTKAYPLGVDTAWLDEQIDNEIDAHGIHTAPGGGLAGNGTTGSPLSLTINHDSSLDGLGTSGSPLTVDTGWLDGQIKDYISANPLAPTAGAAPATVSDDGGISTNIVGGQTQTLGAPEGWAALGNGYMVPLYKAAA